MPLCGDVFPTGPNVWHERWGEDYDAGGDACVKWTDKWAERVLPGGAREQWGDKWHEAFANGRGEKNGEVSRGARSELRDCGREVCVLWPDPAPHAGAADSSKVLTPSHVTRQVIQVSVLAL